MTEKELRDRLDSHEQWLKGTGGAKADFRGVNLSGADLSEVNLSGSDLREANLRGANLRGANLRGTDFRWANLREADLRWADLSGVNLSKADLSGADPRGANLRGVNLRGVNLVHSMCGQYSVYATSTHTSCGCKRLENQQWKSATVESVAGFAGDASDWWRLWGDMVLLMIDKAEQIDAGRESEEVAAAN